MTTHRWREKDLDNQLMLILTSNDPSEERIRELVRNGADVNSIKDGDSVLMDALSFTNDYGGTEKSLDLRFIRLLVELGAEVNYVSEEGDSPIMSACFTHRWEPVECILQLGANPNHISDGDTTPLSWADTDQYYHEEISPDEIAAAQLKETVRLLKQYGAKYRDDLFTEKLERWLQVCAFLPTGLFTLWGNIDVASINGVTEELTSEFRRWHESNWDQWYDKSWDDMPKGFDRKRHNEWGRELASQIRKLIPQEIKMEYLFVNAEDEKRKVRNVVREAII